MKSNKKDIIEIVGIFAIVISLIFVGVQLRLERKMAMAEQYFNRAESVKEDYRTLLLSPEYFRAIEDNWTRTGESYFDKYDWQEMAEVREGTRRISSIYGAVLDNRLAIVGYDNLYFQYKQGFIDEETWIGLRGALKRSMSGSQISRDIYQLAARPNIKPVIEEILREIEAEK